MRERLLIVGASARAAAESALRANFLPMAVDHFGDQDLRRIADLRVCEQFPDEIPLRAAELPPGPVVLTGAMENHPSVIKKLAATRPLYGCPPKAISAVRDPVGVQAILKQCNLPTIPTCNSIPNHPTGELWLKKPRRASNGAGICMQVENDTSADTKTFYYQKFIKGQSYSALFVASAQSTTLVGVTEQWVGIPWLNARPFGYAGSLGPLPLKGGIRTHWERIGDSLTKNCDLRGFFGVDAVVNQDEIYVVEINPRFTASAEIVDTAGDGQLMQHHVRACLGGQVEIPTQPASNLVQAKAIYFAPQDIIVPNGIETWPGETFNEDTRICLADIPASGIKIKKGNPVTTLLVTGFDEKKTRWQLKLAAKQLQDYLSCNLAQGVDPQAV